ncbi:MAG: hypothetical protein MZV65_49050 [Chromatiales bacterium]|nr:hypothetical protein [Chromatiales bacterium]
MSGAQLLILIVVTALVSSLSTLALELGRVPEVGSAATGSPADGVFRVAGSAGEGGRGRGRPGVAGTVARAGQGGVEDAVIELLPRVRGGIGGWGSGRRGGKVYRHFGTRYEKDSLTPSAR